MPVWHWVTVAFSDLRVSSSGIDRPIVTPRPTTTTCAPLISTPWWRSSCTTPCGVQGSGPCSLSTSHFQAHRVQTVGVLGRIHEFQDAVRVDALGQGQLHDVTGARGVGVEFADDVLDLLLRGGVGEFALDGADTDLGAVLVLAVHVPPAARVVPDEQGSQAGGDTPGLEGRHADGEIGLDRGCGGLAIENLGSHVPILADDPAQGPIADTARGHKVALGQLLGQRLDKLTFGL